MIMNFKSHYQLQHHAKGKVELCFGYHFLSIFSNRAELNSEFGRRRKINGEAGALIREAVSSRFSFCFFFFFFFACALKNTQTMTKMSSKLHQNDKIHNKIL